MTWRATSSEPSHPILVRSITSRPIALKKGMQRRMLLAPTTHTVVRVSLAGSFAVRVLTGDSPGLQSSISVELRTIRSARMSSSGALPSSGVLLTRRGLVSTKRKVVRAAFFEREEGIAIALKAGAETSPVVGSAASLCASPAQQSKSPSVPELYTLANQQASMAKSEAREGGQSTLGIGVSGQIRIPGNFEPSLVMQVI